MYKMIKRKAYGKISNKVNMQYTYAIPTQIGLCISSKCNIKCPYCMRESFTPHGEDIDLVALKKILHHSPSISGVCIMGLCEPLLNKNLVRLINYLAKNKYSISLTTNGTIDFSEEILESFKKISDFVISIDTTNPESFKILRGGAEFKKVWGGLSKVIEFKRRNGLKRLDNPPIHINAVITKKNFNEIEQLIKDLEEYKDDLNYLMVDPVSRPDYSKEMSLFLSKQELEKKVPILRKIAKKSALKVVGFDYMLEPSKNWKECNLSWYSPFIEPNGDVYFCYDYKNILGNVFEDTLIKIWNTKKAREFRAELMTQSPPLKQCEYCNFARGGWQKDGAYNKRHEDVLY